MVCSLQVEQVFVVCVNDHQMASAHQQSHSSRANFKKFMIPNTVVSAGEKVLEKKVTSLDFSILLL